MKDSLSQYEAICDSYRNMPITTLVVLQELLEIELKERRAGFYGENEGKGKAGVGDVGGRISLNHYGNNEQKGELGTNKQVVRPTLSIVRND